MRRPRGRRSERNSNMVLSWTCSHNHFNPVDSRELFDIPRFVCGCGCEEQFRGDFDFSMSNVEVNGWNLVGKPLDQKDEGLCVPFAYGKQMEITKNMKALTQNKPLTDSFRTNPYHLEKSFIDTPGALADTSGPTKVIVMAQILKTKGICSKDRKTIFKASNVSTIRMEDTPGIVAALADGFPLNAAFCPGKRLKEARYCRPYKPPSNEKMMAKFEASETQTSVPAHAAVLVGARRINGKLDYYFMNSWKHFCVRRDSHGRVIPGHHGVGKIDAKRLIRNLVRISRFKEAPTERSFVTEHLPLDFDDSPNVRLLVD